MQGLHFSRTRWLIIWMVTWCLCAVFAAVYLRVQDEGYAQRVSNTEYRLCKDSEPIGKTPVCEIRAEQTYDLLDPGFGSALISAGIPLLVLWLIVGTLFVAGVTMQRAVRGLISFAKTVAVRPSAPGTNHQEKGLDFKNYQQKFPERFTPGR